MNFNNDIPIYLQIVDIITNDISSGKLKPGQKIPSVREYAMFFKANPNTICKALSILEDKKLIYTERTNGKFVTRDVKLINKVRDNLAKEKALEFFSSMKTIGMDEVTTINYLQDLINK